MQLGSQ
jgi:hypothetical protein